MKVKEIKIDRKEFNLIVNDILLDVKPIKLRIKIANRLLEHFDNKQEQLQNLEAKLAESEKAYTDLKELEQATTESLYASRKYLDELKSEKWALEQQLTEKDLRIEELESQFAYECECNKQFVECQNENTQLKQQLAEKEKEKQDVFDMFEAEVKQNWIHICENAKLREDKISFAVEQLEKVKEFLVSGYAVDNEEIEKEINNQIEELKKEMK